MTSMYDKGVIMKVLTDILGRTLFMSFFIILLPIGAYTIHNGSSAMAAAFSYAVLSVCIPFFYLTSSRSGFGPSEKRANRWIYILMWFLIQVGTYGIFMVFDLTWLWELPTIGRDVVFILIMYCQVAMGLWLAYGVSGLVRGEQ